MEQRQRDDSPRRDRLTCAVLDSALHAHDIFSNYANRSRVSPEGAAQKHVCWIWCVDNFPNCLYFCVSIFYFHYIFL